MKSYITLIPTLILLIVLTACGASDQDKKDALAGKKAELDKLKAEQKALTEKIAKLEGEIALLDTAAANQVKVIPVSVAPVEIKDFKHFVEVQGQIDADNNILVMPRNPQLVVTRILVDEGQRVSKGQLLATQDNSVIKSAIAEIESGLDLAKTLYDKQKRLWDQGIGTEVQYLQAKNQVESLEKKLATTKEQLKMANIVAPISGTIDKVHIKVGQMPQGQMGTAAFTLVNLSELTFKGELSEAYIPFVKRGDKVKLAFSTVNEELEAKISNVGQTIHPINRTITIEVKLSGKKNTNLRANMLGEMIINDYSKDSAVVVPSSYVQKGDDGTQYIYTVQEDDKGRAVAKQTTVQPGYKYDGMTEIKSGLTGKEQIVTIGYQKMTDGQVISF